MKCPSCGTTERPFGPPIYPPEEDYYLCRVCRFEGVIEDFWTEDDQKRFEEILAFFDMEITPEGELRKRRTIESNDDL